MGARVTPRIARTRRSPCAGLASASITTTPSAVTTNPALGRPSEPRPVSPSTAYTPGARARRGNASGAGRGGLAHAAAAAPAAPVVLPHDLQLGLAVGTERELHERVATDAGRPHEAGHFLAAVGDAHV